MCYNYSIHGKKADLEKKVKRKFLLEVGDLYKPHYNADGFRHLPLPVITTENKANIDLLEWGLIPVWAKDENEAKDLRKGALNAKSETLFDLKSFKNLAPSKRCLVLADGIFEPHHNEDGTVTYYYITKKSNDLFLLGGLWNYWKSRETGKEVRSFTIITTPPNKLFAEVHNAKPRMPLILPEHQADAWLSSDISSNDIKSLMVPYEDESDLIYWPVSKLINNRRNNSDVSEVIEKATGLF